MFLRSSYFLLGWSITKAKGVFSANFTHSVLGHHSWLPRKDRKPMTHPFVPPSMSLFWPWPRTFSGLRSVESSQMWNYFCVCQTTRPPNCQHPILRPRDEYPGVLMTCCEYAAEFCGCSMSLLVSYLSSKYYL